MSSEGSHGPPWVEDGKDVDRATIIHGRVRQLADAPASLSGVDGRRLAEALARVMSPDVLADADAWQECTARVVRDLVSADAAFLVVESQARRYVNVGLDDAIIRDYRDHFARVDHGIARQRARRVDVWSRRVLWAKQELAGSEYYHDFARPHRLLDSVGVACFEGPSYARISVLYAKPLATRQEATALRLLDLVRPALQVGAAMTLRWQGQQGIVEQLVDRVSRPLALCSASGRMIHQNPELIREIARDPHQLPELIRRVARAVMENSDPRGSPASSSNELCEHHGRWSVLGSRLDWEFGRLMPAVLVSLVHRNAEAPASELLRAQYEQLQKTYGLTCRQMQVLELLGLRRSNAEIAQALRISEHTARHHTEIVLAKLGLHSRSDVELHCMQQVADVGDKCPARSRSHETRTGGLPLGFPSSHRDD